MGTALTRIFLAIFILVAFVHPDARAQTPFQRVRIAYASSGLNFADLLLAKDKGFSREDGLDPQRIQMSSNIAITAAIAGEVDGQALIASALRAMQRGAPLRVGAVILRRPVAPAELLDFSLQREIIRGLK